MSQFNFGTMDPAETSGTELAAVLNAWRDALHSLHKGTARPAYAVPGLLWLKDALEPWSLFLYDGEGDILIGSINPSSNVFTPSFGSLSGLLMADGSGGVSPATAEQVVALIGALAVANAAHANSADVCTGNAASASVATTVSDGAVNSTSKLADRIVTLAKFARSGSAGQVLYSGGSGADPYFAAPASAGVTSVNGAGGAVTITPAGIGAAPESHTHSYAGLDAIVAATQVTAYYINWYGNNGYWPAVRFTRANGSTFDVGTT